MDWRQQQRHTVQQTSKQSIPFMDPSLTIEKCFAMVIENKPLPTPGHKDTPLFLHDCESNWDKLNISFCCAAMSCYKGGEKKEFCCFYIVEATMTQIFHPDPVWLFPIKSTLHLEKVLRCHDRHNLFHYPLS